MLIGAEIERRIVQGQQRIDDCGKFSGSLAWQWRLAALIHNPDISCVLNIEYLVIYSDFVSFSTRPSSSRVAPEFD